MLLQTSKGDQSDRNDQVGGFQAEYTSLQNCVLNFNERSEKRQRLCSTAWGVSHKLSRQSVL